MAAVLINVQCPKIGEQLRLFSKRCCACGHVKDWDEFHFCARAPDHRQYQCRSCRSEYDRRRRIVVMVSDTPVRLLWKPPPVSIRYTSTLSMEASGT